MIELLDEYGHRLCRDCKGSGLADERRGLVGDCWWCRGTGYEVNG